MGSAVPEALRASAVFGWLMGDSSMLSPLMADLPVVGVLAGVSLGVSLVGSSSGRLLGSPIRGQSIIDSL